MKILIFGGGFSPPTIAHEAIIAACLRLPQFNEVWVMPSGDRIDKTISLTDRERLSVLEAMRLGSFGGDPRLKVSDFELRLPRPSQTSTTFIELAKTFPAAEFWLALGRDSYIGMPGWPSGQTLQNKLNMVVFCSGAGPEIDAANVTIVDLGDTYADVSSSEIRRRLKSGENIDGLVSQSVKRHLMGALQ